MSSSSSISNSVLLVTDTFWEPTGPGAPGPGILGGGFPGDANGRLVVVKDFLTAPGLIVIDLGFSELQTCCEAALPTTLIPSATTTNIDFNDGVFEVILDILYDEGTIFVQRGLVIVPGAIQSDTGTDLYDTCCSSATSTTSEPTGDILVDDDLDPIITDDEFELAVD